jgi:hypothetical protein
MLFKRKDLAVIAGKTAKFYVIESKQFTRISDAAESAEKKGQKMRWISSNLLKTHTEKMSAFDLSKIYMKTNNLHDAFQDVYENKRLGHL